ncbi:MAG: Rieske 2Fe-2S domain-containing protein [Reyranella sp.]|uniref:aromatic ring-hydroxylating oxygenase subunit alpha n=1 Tax=Reyranella sp. TaxID=1929291 RepID=UPI001AD4B6DA|nr:SRPBCC family protein [Reyranella sp.]MBN9087101.1 Rieske 2Fe-2S domain-containing protein [Reyranella sp.]
MPDGERANGSWSRASLMSLFDRERGVLDRRVLSDESLYRLELERIFARGWNFMCHESQLPNTGDYLVNYIGEDQVIVVRDESGRINVLLNTCRHRGNALCRAEQGRAKSFVCTYHGWNYGLDGRLIGVPGLKTYYRDDLDLERHGLVKAAQVDSHLGFVFATMAADAPPLSDYLGDVGLAGLGMVGAFGEVEVIDGIQKNVIDCNWKIAVDNLFDWYHVTYSHASANSSGFTEIARFLQPNQQMVMLGEYGHAISGPAMPKARQDQIDGLSDEQRVEMAKTLPGNIVRIRPKAAAGLMGAEGVRSLGHPNIFPNLWITLGGLQMCLRLPRGPSSTELWWYTVVPKNASPEFRRQAIRFCNHAFGPAGLFEQDDGENWSQSTRAARGVSSGAIGHHLGMGVGRDRVTVSATGERFIETCINEHAQRWLYRSWTEWMAARDWAELRANHSPAPTAAV